MRSCVYVEYLLIPNTNYLESMWILRAKNQKYVLKSRICGKNTDFSKQHGIPLLHSFTIKIYLIFV